MWMLSTRGLMPLSIEECFEDQGKRIHQQIKLTDKQNNRLVGVSEYISLSSSCVT